MRKDRVIAWKTPVVAFPCNKTNKKKPAKEYKKEYEAAIAVGFDVAIYSPETFSWTTDTPEEKRIAIYRGAELNCNNYRELIFSLEIWKVEFINSPGEIDALPKYKVNNVEGSKLKLYEGKSNRWRAYYFNNEIGVISKIGTKENYLAPPKDILDNNKNFESQFYFVDYVELNDESWQIIEVKPGGMAPLPEGQDPFEFYKILKESLEPKRIKLKCKDCKYKGNIGNTEETGSAICTYPSFWFPINLEDDCHFIPQLKELTCGDCARWGEDFACFTCSAYDSAYHRGQLCRGFEDKKERVFSSILNFWKIHGMYDRAHIEEMLDIFEEKYKDLTEQILGTGEK